MKYSPKKKQEERFSDDPGRRLELEKTICPLRKHCGETLGEVMEKDPRYIDWCSDIVPGNNVNMTKMTRDWFNAVREYVQLPIVEREIEKL